MERFPGLTPYWPPPHNALNYPSNSLYPAKILIAYIESNVKNSKSFTRDLSPQGQASPVEAPLTTHGISHFSSARPANPAASSSSPNHAAPTHA